MSNIPPTVESVVLTHDMYEDVTFGYLFEVAFGTSNHAHELQFAANVWDFSFTPLEAEMFFRGDLEEKLDLNAMNIVPVSIGGTVKFCWLIYLHEDGAQGHLRVEGRQCADFVEKFHGKNLKFFFNLDCVVAFVR